MSGRGWRRAAAVLFALALVAQLVVLYVPDPPSDIPAPPGSDKLVHFAVFAAPALLGVLAGLRPLWLGAALVAHAVPSELVQHVLLPGRSGDAWDAVADVAGVAVGLAVGWLARRDARGTIRTADRDPMHPPS
ncbi:VanZ family protein [Agrococcus sp. TF02-05]|uniref:VanZ family protein n=1 Tax=Agrococcus sp. TF02-05 TaxID=2815211 RepID=UPI001AA13191|nr:VanZ family protein [Agrococcus sp. TF02-05]MBO1769249.1 VanZ family protein [Agrococcus sp. TF02-05]